MLNMFKHISDQAMLGEFAPETFLSQAMLGEFAPEQCKL